MDDKFVKAIIAQAEHNMQTRFVDNPCMLIALGQGSDGHFRQVSAIMGRSPPSQNRVYTVEGGKLKTEAADPSKVEDPRLIIYNAMDYFVTQDNEGRAILVASNGAQTDTVMTALLDPHYDEFTHFRKALDTHYCEPDEPTFTPRIAGLQAMGYNDKIIMSLLKADPKAKKEWMQAITQGSTDAFMAGDIKKAKQIYLARMKELTGLDNEAFPTTRNTFELQAVPGMGYCLTTYNPGSKELPSFTGEPFLIPMRGTLEDTMNDIWSRLEPKWRVAMGGRELTEKGAVRYAQPINTREKVN